MEDKELQNIWKSLDKKIDTLLAFNKEILIDMEEKKVMKEIAKLKPVKYLGIIIGFPWVIFLYSATTIGIISGGFFFPLSFGIIAVVTTIALSIYIYHLVLINRIDRTDSVIQVQERIAEIRRSDMIGVKVALLQLPFWSIFWLDVHPDSAYIFIHLFIFILFSILTYVMIKGIRMDNMNSKWVKFLFSGNEWQSLDKASDILSQIEDVK